MLFNFIDPCIKELKAKFTVDITLDKLHRHHQLEDFLANNNPNAHEYMLEKIVRNPEFYNKLEPIPNAMKVIASLSKDFTIWAITARPWNVVVGNRAKMGEFFPAIGDNVIATRDKVEARQRLGSLIHVEDHSGIVKKMAEAGQDTIILDWPYNRDIKEHEKIVRVSSLLEAEEVIRTSLRREKKQ